LAARVQKRINKEPINALTHFLGFLAAIPAVVALVLLSKHDGPKLAGMAVYGGSLVLLFFASSAYHFFDLGPRGNKLLRKLDHTAIFLLIAGTYMPPMIHLLDGAWRTTMISVVLGIALAGIVFKLFWIGCPDWLSAGIYLAMGWIVVIPSPLIIPQLSGWAAFWGALGGAAYSLGAVVYVKRWPDPWPKVFGFHEIWHLFVLCGAGAHFVFTLSFVNTPYTPF